MMQIPPVSYSTRTLPWHAFQKALADELSTPARDGVAQLPLHSWLARALTGATESRPLA